MFCLVSAEQMKHFLTVASNTGYYQLSTWCVLNKQNLIEESFMNFRDKSVNLELQLLELEQLILFLDIRRKVKLIKKKKLKEVF